MIYKVKKLNYSHYKIYGSILVDLKELFFAKRLKFNFSTKQISTLISIVLNVMHIMGIVISHSQRGKNFISVVTCASMNHGRTVA